MIDKLRAALAALEHCSAAIIERGLNGSPEFAEKWGLQLPLESANASITDLKAVIAELEVQEPVAHDDTEVHLSHCNQYENLGWCKYGEDETCPALNPQPKSDTLTPQYESMPAHPVCISCGHRLMSSMTYTCYACNQTSDPKVIREAFEADQLADVDLESPDWVDSQLGAV